MLLLFIIENNLQTELIIFTLLFICTVCAIFFISYFSSLLIQRRENEIQKIRDEKESLLVRLLFEGNSNESNDEILADYDEFRPIEKGNRLGKKKRMLHRQIMVDEMLEMKKNLSGAGVEDLYKLYNKLSLHEYSYQKLTSKKYQLMVMGIRELSEMNFKIYYRSIYRCINHPQEDVRIEAQVAIIRLFGVKGLRFLSIVTYTISEWQQMTLLHLLSHMKKDKPRGFENWFNSKNDSVIIFSLRLAEMYNCFELSDRIRYFLYHPSDALKIQSIFCMRNNYDENTELLLLAYYPIVNKPVKLAMLDVLKSISTGLSIPFLYKQLIDTELEIRFGILRILYRLCEGTEIIDAIENEPEIKDSIILMIDQIKIEEQIYN